MIISIKKREKQTGEKGSEEVFFCRLPNVVDHSSLRNE